jgi:DDE_Tnp_1-associated
MKIEELGQQLSHAFAAIPDPRSPHGKRHPLPAILTLATAAMLNGARSLYAIARWGRLQSPEVVYALSFTRAKTPSVSTLHEVFQILDVEAFEAALASWAQEEVGDWEEITNHTMQLRGIHGEGVPGVELVVAIQTRTGLVLE